MSGHKPKDEDEQPRPKRPPLGSPDQTVTAERVPMAPTMATGSLTPPPPDPAGVTDAGLEQTLRSAGPLDADAPSVESDQHFARGSEIARGGMGRIIRAQDLRLGRPVAIKELLVSSLESERRFEREIQITARLQHPAIIAVYEAGRLPSGLPFFSMKEVEGKPLDKVISAAESMDERLALLPSVIAVAEALSYAHDRHIIHRDLKPGNVLVGDYGETVVIDWGLAKDLSCESPEDIDVFGETWQPAPDAEPDLTALGTAVGTAAYMPPEQAQGQPVDERADVYAMGAMLYHLFAGAMPFGDAKSQNEILERLEFGPPAALSTLAPDIPLDLLTIVERAMARNAKDRYPSAKQLAADLTRFQAGRRVQSHDYSTTALIKRWAARNRGAVSVAAIMMTVLLAVVAVSVSRVYDERDQVSAQRDRAEENQHRVEDLFTFMLTDLGAKLKPIGKTDVLESVATKAGDYYAQLPVDWEKPKEVLNRANALSAIALVYNAQGSSDEALVAYRASLVLRERLAQTEEVTIDAQVRLLDSYDVIGGLLLTRGDLEGAEEMLQAALTNSERLAKGDPTNLNWQRALVSSHEGLGALLTDKGLLPQALAEYQAMLEAAERLAAVAPSNADGQRLLSRAHANIGYTMKVQGNLDQALTSSLTALAIRQRLVDADPENAIFLSALSESLDLVGGTSLALDDPDLALESFQNSLTITEKLAKLDPSNADWQRDLAISHRQIGRILAFMGDWVEALDRFRAAESIAERLVDMDPANLAWRRDLALYHDDISEAFVNLDKIEEATVESRASLMIREGTAQQDPVNTTWQSDLALSYTKVAHLEVYQEDTEQAIESYRKALAIRRRLAERDPTNNSWQQSLSWTLRTLAEALLQQGKTDEAQGLFEECSAVDGAVVVSPRHALGIALCKTTTGDFDGAFQWLHKSVDLGYRSPTRFNRTTLLGPLRVDPRWQKLLARCDAK